MDRIELTKAEYAGVKFLLERNAPGQCTADDMAAYRRHRMAQRLDLTRGEAYAAGRRSFEVEKRCNPQEWRALNEDFGQFVEYHAAEALGLERRDISHLPGSVYTTPTLSTIASQYGNDEYIGDDLLTHISSAKQTGTFPQFGQRDRIQIQDDSFGARGYANEIDEAHTWGTYNCVSRGLSDRVSAMALANQDAPLDEMVDMAQAVAERRAIARENRQATLFCAPAGYGANTFALAAANRWNAAGGGNPIADIQRARAMLWSGRGPGLVKAFTSLTVFNVLSRHPQLLQLFVFNGSSPGLATPDMLAKWFDMDTLLVGRGRVDTAQEGAATAFAYLWEPAAAFFFGIVRVAIGGVRNAGFAVRFEQGGVITNVVYDPQNGHGGSYKLQESDCAIDQVWCAPCGALITTPI